LRQHWPPSARIRSDGFFLSPVGIAYEWAIGNRVAALLALWLMTAECLLVTRNSWKSSNFTGEFQIQVNRRTATEPFKEKLGIPNMMQLIQRATQ